MHKQGMVKVGGLFIKEEKNREIQQLVNDMKWDEAIKKFRSLTGVSAGRAKVILGLVDKEKNQEA